MPCDQLYDHIYQRMRYSKCRVYLRRSLWLSSLTAHTRWRNQWRSQLIGTGHLDTTWPRIRMIGRQRAAPGKCVGFRRLSWAESDTGRGLSAPIIHCVIELDSPANAIGPDLK